jgi:hypothetical protein
MFDHRLKPQAKAEEEMIDGKVIISYYCWKSDKNNRRQRRD